MSLITILIVKPTKETPPTKLEGDRDKICFYGQFPQHIYGKLNILRKTEQNQNYIEVAFV